eukprot:SAG31_NODE_150_length_22290_cov_5.975801_3_plen_82_part_00
MWAQRLQKRNQRNQRNQRTGRVSTSRNRQPGSWQAASLAPAPTDCAAAVDEFMAQGGGEAGRSAQLVGGAGYSPPAVGGTS